MEEETITLPTITKDEVKNAILGLIDINQILNNKDYWILFAIKKERLDLLNSLNPIIHQICDCLIINANIAAITLTNFLIERTLKLGIIIKEGNGKTYENDAPIDCVFKDEINNFDDKEMEQTINKTKTIGLITKDESKILKRFKSKFRNPFSHANFQKILDGSTTKLFKMSLSNPADFKEETANLSNTPLLQECGLPEYCKIQSFNYFVEIFAIALKIDNRLKKLYAKKHQYTTQPQALD